MAETAIPHSPVIVHHLSNSRSQRILWLLPPTQEELEIPYEIRKWHRTPEIAAPTELRQIHPLGGSPIIEDGDLVLAESGAIIEYPIAKYGNGRFSPSEAGWTDNLYWGTLMPYLVNLLAFSIVPDRAPLIVRPILRMAFNGLISQMIVPRLEISSKMIEKHLAKKAGRFFFAAGEIIKPTDFQMAFALEMWLGGGPELSPVGEHAHKFVETVAY
ncbi:glutathione S-transferase [Rhizoctonia solani]|uniref:Glutathione S-transferase n=1 Tax=Rhizoctonia solani TaxID=456999 RepID=A0A8H8SYJ6_9AGAM|nr:glutathione S-transferase [Rhizoctonia solani]QRW23291.1 glutathione S-transferase [Rhizoctonia solani]